MQILFLNDVNLDGTFSYACVVSRSAKVIQSQFATPKNSHLK